MIIQRCESISFIRRVERRTGNPVQRGHIYHQDESLGYMAGVWDCTANTGKFEPYAVHEFMFVLEGSVIMVLEDGAEITVNAGEPYRHSQKAARANANTKIIGAGLKSGVRDGA